MKNLLFLLKLCGVMILGFMVYRTVIFMSWFLQQPTYSMNPEFWSSQEASTQYDWTLWLTGIGWVLVFLGFTQSQKKNLARPGDYQNITRRLSSWWFLNKGWEKDEENKKK